MSLELNVKISVDGDPDQRVTIAHAVIGNLEATGVAKRHPGDRRNAELAVELATARALRKLVDALDVKINAVFDAEAAEAAHEDDRRARRERIARAQDYRQRQNAKFPESAAARREAGRKAWAALQEADQKRQEGALVDDHGPEVLSLSSDVDVTPGPLSKTWLNRISAANSRKR